VEGRKKSWWGSDTNTGKETWYRERRMEIKGKRVTERMGIEKERKKVREIERGSKEKEKK
jgi:hypothetical protein